jgi:hypothetical protein
MDMALPVRPSAEGLGSLGATVARFADHRVEADVPTAGTEKAEHVRHLPGARMYRRRAAAQIACTRVGCD